MKNFSDEMEKDRKFEVGGVVLEWEYPYWEDLADIFDDEVGDVSTKEALAQTIDRISLFLTDETRPEWKKVARRKKNPIPLFQISGIYRWLLEVSSGRPTQSLSGSEPGGGNSEPSSPGASPSTEATSKK